MRAPATRRRWRRGSPATRTPSWPRRGGRRKGQDAPARLHEGAPRRLTDRFPGHRLSRLVEGEQKVVVPSHRFVQTQSVRDGERAIHPKEGGGREGVLRLRQLRLGDEVRLETLQLLEDDGLNLGKRPALLHHGIDVEEARVLVV